ncbi:hypothetical protein PIB30_062602 [Stylosanthes scabra]|uniref:Uncharacterized protein n=1 Tax=Stylosanthes scabra TaxID=79078 RepID=A0ABU6XLZ4_9FABA|nr:hypothetical protein [Stylosanthes scabra]
MISSSLGEFMCYTVCFSRNPYEPYFWFSAKIIASLSAEASADRAEVNNLFAVVDVRSLPSESLKTAAPDPTPELAENAASTLLLIHPLGGGWQVAFLCHFLA